MCIAWFRQRRCPKVRRSRCSSRTTTRRRTREIRRCPPAGLCGASARSTRWAICGCRCRRVPTRSGRSSIERSGRRWRQRASRDTRRSFVRIRHEHHSTTMRRCWRAKLGGSIRRSRTSRRRCSSSRSSAAAHQNLGAALADAGQLERRSGTTRGPSPSIRITPSPARTSVGP